MGETTGISSEAAKDPFYTKNVQKFLVAGIGSMFKLNKFKLL